MNDIEWFDNGPFSKESPQSKRDFLLVIVMLLAISYTLAFLTATSLGIPTLYILKIGIVAGVFLLSFSLTLKHLFITTAANIGLTNRYMVIKDRRGREQIIPFYEITEITQCRYPYNKDGKKEDNLLI